MQVNDTRSAIAAMICLAFSFILASIDIQIRPRFKNSAEDCSSKSKADGRLYPGTNTECHLGNKSFQKEEATNGFQSLRFQLNSVFIVSQKSVVYPNVTLWNRNNARQRVWKRRLQKNDNNNYPKAEKDTSSSSVFHKNKAKGYKF